MSSPVSAAEGYSRWAINANRVAVGVEEFDERLAAAMI
jgi:hypothetical protein